MYSYSLLSASSYPVNQAKVSNFEVTGRIESINYTFPGLLKIEIKPENWRYKKRRDTNYVYGSNSYNTNFICRISDSVEAKLMAAYLKLKPGNRIQLTGVFYLPKGKRNPGDFDYSNFLLQKNISGTVYLNSVSGIKLRDENTYLFKNFIHSLRVSIHLKIRELYSGNTASLLKGLLLGDRTEIDTEITENFKTAGIIHLLAVSGLHTGFIALICVFLFQRLGRNFRLIATIIVLLLFLAITNFNTPVLRATIMAIVYIAALLSNRNTNQFNNLAIAALIITFINPLDPLSTGFQLSFLSVGFILFASGFLQKFRDKYSNATETDKLDTPFRIKIAKSRILYGIFAFFVISITAQIATLPLILYYFSSVSVVGLITNTFAIPLAGLILQNGLLSVALGYILLPAGSVFAQTTNLLTYLLIEPTEFIASFKYSSIEFFGLTKTGVFFIYVMISLIVFSLVKLKSKLLRIVIPVLLAVNLFIWTSFFSPELMPKGKFTLIAIDVGQGDCFLIREPGGKYFIIDTGPVTERFNAAKNIVLPLLKRVKVKEIEQLHISHYDNDHSGGIFTLIENVKIKVHLIFRWQKY
ncbi:MAG: ComEC/Rec2 family competence protein [Ignavibacteriaceae bacterium]|nr:ComEC/Rec2 family competence protein [Ignavibacteriaceae bacterium]